MRRWALSEVDPGRCFFVATVFQRFGIKINKNFTKSPTKRFTLASNVARAGNSEALAG